MRADPQRSPCGSGFGPTLFAARAARRYTGIVSCDSRFPRPDRRGLRRHQRGWVGLVVPHIGRMLVGPDFRRLIPVSAVLGASFLLVVDDIARTLTAAEIPLGVLTALIGAPFFAYLLTRKRVGWS